MRSLPQFVAMPLAALLLPHAAQAADGADHLNVQEPPRPAFLPAKPGAGFELPPVPKAPEARAAAGAPTALVERFAFRGNQAIPTAELEAVAAPYAGRRIGDADVEELRQKLTRYYIDRGYINSGAVLGKDALSGTTVTFDLVEGKLTAVQLRGMERLDDAYVAGRLAKAGDNALNVDVLRERFQLLLDDPLFERMNARLMPGGRLGEALLDIDVVRARPYQLTLSANNYRPPSIGSNAASLSGWVRNLTGLGDTLDGSLQSPVSSGSDGGRYSLGWRLPLNQNGTQVSLQLDHGRSSIIEQPMQSLDIRSTLDSKDIGISQVFHESLRRKFSMGLNYVDRENKTTLLGQPFSFTPGEPNGVTKVTSWRFWQEYSTRSEKQVLALRSTFTWSKDNIQKVTGLPVGGSTPPDASYRLWLGQVQYARQVLDNGAQAIVRGSVQQTGSNLTALDRMSIGGVNTVRGYRENLLIRDTGTVVNFEFDYPVATAPGKGLNFSLIPFYDRGRGRNLSEGPADVSSWGLATRLRWQGASLDLAVAHRLTHPTDVTTAGGTLQDKGVHMQFGYSFF